MLNSKEGTRSYDFSNGLDNLIDTGERLGLDDKQIINATSHYLAFFSGEQNYRSFRMLSACTLILRGYSISKSKPLINVRNGIKC